MQLLQNNNVSLTDHYEDAHVAFQEQLEVSTTTEVESEDETTSELRRPRKTIDYRKLADGCLQDADNLRQKSLGEVSKLPKLLNYPHGIKRRPLQDIDTATTTLDFQDSKIAVLHRKKYQKKRITIPDGPLSAALSPPPSRKSPFSEICANVWDETNADSKLLQISGKQ